MIFLTWEINYARHKPRPLFDPFSCFFNGLLPTSFSLFSSPRYSWHKTTGLGSHKKFTLLYWTCKGLPWLATKNPVLSFDRCPNLNWKPPLMEAIAPSAVPKHWQFWRDYFKERRHWIEIFYCRLKNGIFVRAKVEKPRKSNTLQMTS